MYADRLLAGLDIGCAAGARAQALLSAARATTAFDGDAELVAQFAQRARTAFDRRVDLFFGDGATHANIHSLVLSPEFGPPQAVTAHLVRMSLPLRVARST